MRRVEEILSNEVESRSADEEQSIAPAAGALKSKRLTFAWLDGEAQKVNICVCLFKCYFIMHALGNNIDSTIYSVCYYVVVNLKTSKISTAW